MQKRTFKTKKVLSGGKSEYRAWKEWNEEDTLICKLIDKRPNKTYTDKTDYVVEVIERHFENKKDEKRIFPKIGDKAGCRLTLNSTGKLDKALENVEPGAILSIIYNGEKKIEGGKFKGKPAHDMDIEEVVEEGSDEDYEEEEEYSEDEDSEDEDDL